MTAQIIEYKRRNFLSYQARNRVDVIDFLKKHPFQKLPNQIITPSPFFIQSKKNRRKLHKEPVLLKYGDYLALDYLGKGGMGTVFRGIANPFGALERIVESLSSQEKFALFSTTISY